MENKYYTPDISEFYISFEYERVDNKIWINDSIKHGMDIHAIQFHLRNPSMGGWPKIRVKYLDSSDIESLGFKLSEKKDPFGQLQFHKKVEQSFNCGYYLTIRLSEIYGNNARFIEIEYESYSHYENNKYKIRPIINNKSELIKLFKQLGIYDKS